MVDLFKSLNVERDSKITQLEHKLEENHNMMECRVSTLEENLEQFKKDLAAEKSTNNKLRAQLTDSKNAHDELEAYGRRESLVFSGDAVKPSQPNEDCCIIARDLIKNVLKIQKDPLMSTAHRIGKPPASDSSAPDKRGIIVKFVQRDDKFLIMKAAKDKKSFWPVHK